MSSASTRSVIIDSVIAKWTLTLVVDEPPISGNPFRGCRDRHATKHGRRSGASHCKCAGQTLRPAHASLGSGGGQTGRDCALGKLADKGSAQPHLRAGRRSFGAALCPARSEEHTSELQSLRHLVCRLLLEK